MAIHLDPNSRDMKLNRYIFNVWIGWRFVLTQSVLQFHDIREDNRFYFPHSFPLEYRIDANIFTTHNLILFVRKKKKMQKRYISILFWYRHWVLSTHIAFGAWLGISIRTENGRLNGKKFPRINVCVWFRCWRSFGIMISTHIHTHTHRHTVIELKFAIRWGMTKLCIHFLRLVLPFRRFCVPKSTKQNAINIHSKQLNSR